MAQENPTHEHDAEQGDSRPNEASNTPDRDTATKKKSNLVSNILIVVGVVLLVVAGFIYLQNMQNYQKIDEENERVAEYAKLSDDENTPPNVDWEALKAMNPDVVGWLQVPGTVVNYPVFQTNDNDYYLNHAPDRSDSIGGSVFLDYENAAPGMVDAQTIVYGHHMRNGSQFKQIADMEDQSLFDVVKTVWYVTEKNGAYNLAPVFLYYTNEDDLDVRQFTFDNDEAYRNYLKMYFEKAQTKRPDAEQILAQVKHIFTLSTCNYYDGLGRTLLVCAPKSEIPGTPEYEAAKAAEAKAAEAKKAEEQQQPEDQQAEPQQESQQDEPQQEVQQAEPQQQEAQPQSNEADAEAGIEG